MRKQRQTTGSQPPLEAISVDRFPPSDRDAIVADEADESRNPLSC